MATGRSNMLIKQLGEYLVACELARRGYLVATFSGNVPEFDIVATNLKGSSCPIQVKTVKKGSWQFSIDKFAEIRFEGNKQFLEARKTLSMPDLICVFVMSGENYGEDQFFVLELSKVQDLLIANYISWLDSHGGVRPRKCDSLHCILSQSDVEPYKDNWSIIDKRI